MRTMAESDFDAELYETEQRHGYRRLRPDADGRGVLDLEDLRLSSAFSPIYSRAHGQPVGHRARLVVSSEGVERSPEHGRSLLAERDRIRQAEALANGLHMHNYASFPDRGWLVLELPAAVVDHAPLWPPLPQDLFSSAGLAPRDLMLEVDADAGTSERLADFVSYHHSLGFAVALRAGARVDLDRIWATAADLVCLDARRFTSPRNGAGGGRTRLLTALTRGLHECRAMVSLRGVDDAAMLAAVLTTDADLLEGDAAADCRDAPLRAEVLAARRELAPLREAVAGCSRAIADGQIFEAACERLLGEPRVLRCFLLDDEGVQLTDNLSRVGQHSDARYWPLASAVGACWAQRDYFGNACDHEGSVTVTGPYFSLPDGRQCTTLAVAFRAGEQRLVLCCDVTAEEDG